MKFLINPFIILLFASCQTPSLSQNWAINENSKLEGRTYIHDTCKECMVRILSIQELEKMAYRKIDANGRNDKTAQLEFALSVLWVDSDEIIVEKKSENAPIVWGNGSSENGEVKFAITFVEKANSRKVVLLLTPPGAFESIGGLSVLRNNDFDNVLATKEIANNQKELSNKKESPISKIKSKKYPLPLGIKNNAGKVYWKGWTYEDDFHAVGAIDDPSAPKFALEVIKVAEVRDFKAAIEKTLEMNNIQSASYEPLERMDVSKQMLGNDMFFTIGKSILAGKEAVLFIRVERVKNNSNYFVLVMEVPKITYREWGGISAILLATQVIKSMDSIPKSRKQQIAKASPAQQMAIFESAYTSIMQQYYKGIMMSQSQTLLRMQELNYDLLLADDITDPGIGN